MSPPKLLRSAILWATAFLTAFTSLSHAAQPAKQKASAPTGTTTPAASEADDLRLRKMDAVRKVNDAALSGDRPAAMQIVKEAQATFGIADPFSEELRGRALTLLKDYPGAEDAFRAMLLRAPDSRVGRFNLAEVIFLAKRYPESERAFADLERTTREADPAFADFCRFKRVVCFLAHGSKDLAEGLVRTEKLALPEGIAQAPPSPAMRYSKAAILYAKQQLDLANGEIVAARNDFSPQVEETFVDSFIELGWGAKDEKTGFAFIRK